MAEQIAKERFWLHAPTALSLAAVTLRPAPTEEEARSAVTRAVESIGGLCGKIVQKQDGTAEWVDGPAQIDFAATPLETEYDWFETVENLRLDHLDVFTGELCRFRLLLAKEEAVLVCALHAAAGDTASLLLLLERVAAALDHPDLTLKPIPRKEIGRELPIGKKLGGMAAMMVNMSSKRWAQQGRPFTPADYQKLCAADGALPVPVICFREFSAERSREIERVCAEEGITPEDAALAALAMAWHEPCEANLTLSLRGECGEGFGDLSTAAALAADPRATDLIPLAKNLAASRKLASGDPEKKYFRMRFLTAAGPGMQDAVWYQTYGLIRHAMVAQVADLLSFGSHARRFALTDGGTLPTGEKTKFSGLRLLAPHQPDALCTATLGRCGGSLTVTIQFADDGDADGNAERFEDAMDLLEEMTV